MDNEQKLLNVIKYNLNNSEKLLEEATNLNLDNKIINMENKNFLEDSDSALESIKNEMSNLGIDIYKNIEKKDVLLDTENSEELGNQRIVINDMKKKSFDELSELAIGEGYTDTNIADILTDGEIKEALNRVDEINALFSKKTKLNKPDIVFLFIATALQCLRQYVFTNDSFRLDKDGDASKWLEKNTKLGKIGLLGPVSYDAFKYADKSVFSELTGLSGMNHRHTTFAHDNILGWFFGPINILTETVTKKDLLCTSYKTKLIKGKTGKGEYKISGFTLFPVEFNQSIDRIQSNPTDLGLAVGKHAVHLGTDYFTKQGLPIPLIDLIVPNISATLSNKDHRIDSYSVTRGAVFSYVINLLISIIHGLFYNPDKHGSRELYEVRTRKILLYSNVLASSSNLAVVGLTKDFKKLDTGGLLITISRLFQDISFITKVKKDFIFNELDEDFQRENDKLDQLLLSLE